MENRVSDLETEVFGDGKHVGLTHRMKRVEAFMFADASTGARGLVATVAELTEYVQSLRTTLKVLNWLLGLLGLGGVLAFFQWLYVVGQAS